MVHIQSSLSNNILERETDVFVVINELPRSAPANKRVISATFDEVGK